MRALLVEDDATIAEFVARGLREAGFVVDHATDGEAGLTAAVAQPYDVAIVDVMLPTPRRLVADRGAAPARRHDAGADSERAARDR